MSAQNISDTLLHAIQSGDAEQVRTLIERNAHLNWEYGNTPLSVAAEEGQLEVVRLLLDAGVPVDEEDEHDGNPGSDRTALSAAAANGHLKVAKLLIERGADINHSSTPLINASSDLAMTRLLIESGADPEQEDEEGRSAIVYAAEEGYPEVVQFLADAAGWEHDEGLEELLESAREAAAERED